MMPLCIPPPFHIKEHQNSSLCSATDVYDFFFFSFYNNFWVCRTGMSSLDVFYVFYVMSEV